MNNCVQLLEEPTRMRPESDEHSSQWSDITEAIASQRRGSSRKKKSTPLQDPFSDPRYEEKVIQLRSFEALNASRSEPCPEDFVLEHPSRKSCPGRRSQTERHLKSAFHGGGEKEFEVAAQEEEEVIDLDMDADTHASSIMVSPAAELHSFPQTQRQRQSLGTTESSLQQRRNTHVPSSSYSIATTGAAKLVTLQRVEPGCVRTSSIYEDDVDYRHSYAAAYNSNHGNNNNNNNSTNNYGYSYYHHNDHSNSERRAGGPAAKRRPATVGFEPKPTQGELMSSNSKSSSHASADPFRFDGDRYSPFLKSSAERDVSRALYREDSNLTATPGSNATATATAAAKVEDAVKVPVLKHAALETASDEHPLSQPQLDDDLIINSSLSERERQHDAEEDWQTVTTEQTRRPRALELTLRLDRDVGSSLADISVSGASDDDFDHFVGGTSAEVQFRSAQNIPPLAPPAPSQRERAFGHSAQRPTDHVLRQSYQKHHRRPARAAAAIRHLSNRLSPDLFGTRTRLRDPIPSYASLDSDLHREYQHEPHHPRTAPRADGDGDVHDDDDDDNDVKEEEEEDQDSPPFRTNNWPVSVLRLDSQEILGHGIHHHNNHNTTYHHPPRHFAATAAAAASSSSSHHHHHRSSLTTTSLTLPRFPFPLISLPEAAALQSQRRQRGQEDHSDPGPAFAAKARSCTVSTISTNGPHTPASPARISSSCWLAKPKQTYRPHEPTHTLPNPSPDLLDPYPYPDPDPHPSFFRTSLPTSSLLSARFFRLSNFSARSRSRVRTRRAQHHHPNSFFTPSQTDLIRSAREDILFRRRHHTEDDAPQRRIFLLILLLTIFFPLIGLLALWGKFDGTIAWYARGERGGLTREQRGTLKQQLLVEAFLYPALIIALSVYYSVHD
ncbi:hypothetical protein E4U55_005124 [Claviceps digitariae]|nr:hypothetical protein E4U55_005124 [Claviceps digitariae]